MSLRLPGGHAFSKKHSHPPRACSVQGSFCVRVSLQTDASAAGEAEPSSKADAAEVIQSLERSCDTSVKENRLHTCLVASLLRNPDLSKSQRTGWGLRAMPACVSGDGQGRPQWIIFLNIPSHLSICCLFPGVEPIVWPDLRTSECISQGYTFGYTCTC